MQSRVARLQVVLAMIQRERTSLIRAVGRSDVSRPGRAHAQPRRVRSLGGLARKPDDRGLPGGESAARADDVPPHGRCSFTPGARGQSGLARAQLPPGTILRRPRGGPVAGTRKPILAQCRRPPDAQVRQRGLGGVDDVRPRREFAVRHARTVVEGRVQARYGRTLTCQRGGPVRAARCGAFAGSFLHSPRNFVQNGDYSSGTLANLVDVIFFVRQVRPLCIQCD